jgi:cytochrome c biogenesis protein CcmG, thiol:disulfide interchange protein DsbE
MGSGSPTQRDGAAGTTLRPDQTTVDGNPHTDSAEFPEEVLWTPFPRPRVGAARNIAAAVAAGFVIIGLVWFFGQGGGVGSSQAIRLTAEASGSAPRVGELAPNFRVRDLEGNIVELSDLRGQPVWINFWASWCPPCRAENPDIQAVYEEHASAGLVILAISIAEDEGTVRDYVMRTGLTFTFALDQTTEIAARYRIVGIPTHFFIDADGILREWRIGSMSKKMMETRVQEVMSTAPSSGAR